mmetsp:Transcript_22253/g.27288  ORF Transcript_22253/g.27288 Transcript_22253/m.27288 type:complete len:441 (+) Transcript_22253:151-1473(+)
MQKGYDSSDDEMQEANTGNRLGDQLHRTANNQGGNDQRNGLRARNDQETEGNLNFEPARNRPRPSFIPHDLNCNKIRRIMNKSTQVDLSTLERGRDLHMNTQGINLNRILLIGQLMWIVTPGIDQSSSTYSYYKRSQAKNTTGCSYNRILFFRFVSETNSSQNNRLFCVVHQKMQKNNVFFDRTPNARDNGFVTIGTLIAIVNPEPIEDYMNGTPMIVSHEKAILLNPMIHKEIPMCSDLAANETKAFVITDSSIEITHVVFLDSKCSGKFCDRQNIEITHSKNRNCGCFSMKSSFSNIISVHSIVFTTKTGERKLMTKFSSLKFMELYTKGKLSIDVRASNLHSGNDAYDDILDCLENIIDLINNDGGWVVYGWVKQGVINDVVMLGNEANKDQTDNKVLSEHVSNHIVHLHPAHIDYRNPNSHRAKRLEDLKYDFSSL